MRRLVGIPATLIMLLSLSACSGKPPSLLNMRYYVLSRPLLEGNASAQSLSLFVSVQDPDGFDDIESMYLINDELGLFWLLNGDTWVKREEGGSTWIGSNGISLPDSGPIPSGSYRVQVLDSAGEKAEREFSLAATQDAPLPLKASLSSDTLEISGVSGPVQILFLDASGQTLFSMPGQTGRQNLPALVADRPEYALAKELTVLHLDDANHRGWYSQRIGVK
jgi:hypothetical protein